MFLCHWRSLQKIFILLVTSRILPLPIVAYLLTGRQHFRSERLRDGAIMVRSKRQQQHVQRVTVDISSSLAVTTCCHYMCRFESFSNCAFFMWFGFSEGDFEVLRIISQWASIELKTTTCSPDTATNNSTTPN